MVILDNLEKNRQSKRKNVKTTMIPPLSNNHVPSLVNVLPTFRVYMMPALNFIEKWSYSMYIGLAKNLRWLQQCLAVSNFIGNTFVRLYCDSGHISVHLQNLIKIGKFLSNHFTFEDGRKCATFLAQYDLLFQER